jgi:hypothetical protein
MAPAARREASVMMEKGHVVSGIERTGAEENVVLRESNVRC